MTPAPNRAEWLRESEQRPLYVALGIRRDDIGAGFAQYVIDPTPASSDGHGSVLSFAATTAADLCVLDATVTTLDREVTNGTAEMNLTYIEAPVGTVTVRGEVATRAANLSIVELTVRNGSGTVIAHGRGSYALGRREAAR